MAAIAGPPAAAVVTHGADDPPRPESTVASIGLRQVWIEPGTFRRGSPPEEDGRRPNETAHTVTLTRGFWLGATEVTQEQFETVMERNPSRFVGADLPADSVPWFEWIEFCNRLSALEGLQPTYRIDGVDVVWDRRADGFRLPTEAEWEYACRAGSTTRFWTGDTVQVLKEVAWFRHNSQALTHPVGSKPANPWGLHDMHGNVGEWCWDWYASYDGQDLIDPVGPESSGRRVLRGGSWRSHPVGCRAACRQTGEPSLRQPWFGARVARGAVED